MKEERTMRKIIIFLLVTITLYSCDFTETQPLWGTYFKLYNMVGYWDVGYDLGNSLTQRLGVHKKDEIIQEVFWNNQFILLNIANDSIFGSSNTYVPNCSTHYIIELVPTDTIDKYGIPWSTKKKGIPCYVTRFENDDYYAELERNNIDTLRMNYLRYSIWWIYEDLEIGIDRWTRKKI